MSTITPNKMRTLADDLDRGNRRHSSEVIADAISTIRAAADELDRLRAPSVTSLPEKVFVVVRGDGEPAGVFVDWYDADSSADESKQGRVVVVELR